VNDGDPTGDDVTEDATPQGDPGVLYREHQRVPLSYWVIGVGVAALIGWQGQMSRSWYWGVIFGVVALAAVAWALIYMSRNQVIVERDGSGETWLHVGEASLPRSAVSRTLPVPPTARSAAMGRQLDPLDEPSRGSSRRLRRPGRLRSGPPPLSPRGVRYPLRIRTPRRTVRQAQSTQM
jgi:hypothetical protein